MYLNVASYLVSILWAGVIVGISFIAQPAKFKTPQLTRTAALATGRQIFRSMHAVEAALATICILLSVFTADQGIQKLIPLYAATLILLVQVFILMPPLSRRVDLLLAGQELQSSSHHLLFAVLEVIKLVLLLVFSLSLLTLTYHG